MINEVKRSYVYIAIFQNEPIVVAHDYKNLLEECDEYFGATEKFKNQAERTLEKKIEYSEHEDDFYSILQYTEIDGTVNNLNVWCKYF